ncbi:hypothetical protein TSUD_64680 [Trifolium subterraneum]|uniref:Uncharacterized protein n=1 Tax=Trifolium subterraneum TaxID=3900 RepID=A0A2Z6N103_TRISU|nr:hypothetical protein TSUD_64680 [Trifolium subterraneum]
MIPQQWASPCGKQCTDKYAAITKLPWRVFCKKGCNSDGDTWEEFFGLLLKQHRLMALPLMAVLEPVWKEFLRLEDCNQLCYKDPVLKDQQWSAYIDRSPGSASYSEECFHACVSGCGYKFEVKPDEADKVSPNRPPKPEPVQKQKPKPVDPIDPPDMPDTSA